MNEPKNSAPETDGADGKSELTEDELEKVPGGAGYVRLRGVDGGNTKGGNVEFEWKVEEGES